MTAGKNASGLSVGSALLASHLDAIGSSYPSLAWFEKCEGNRRSKAWLHFRGEKVRLRRLGLDGYKVFWTLLKATKIEMVNARLRLKAVISKFIIQYTDRSDVYNLKSAILCGIKRV